MRKKGILIILDGYGEGENSLKNPVWTARTPFLRHIKKYFPTTYITASGERVGLKKGQMGNSETGHLNIGAGRVVSQHNVLISNALAKGALENNIKFNETLKKTKEKRGTVHITTLLSDMGAHSQLDHLYSIIQYVALKNMTRIYLHLIVDGRDTRVDEGKDYIIDLQKFIANYPKVQLASICGRYFGMDREGNLDRTKLAFDTMFSKDIKPSNVGILEYVKANYANGISDEFILPARLLPGDEFKTTDNDCVIFANFRSDRMRQLVQMCMDKLNPATSLVTLTNYDVNFKNVLALFPEHKIKGTLSEYLSDSRAKQLKVSETTKFAHVTYFLNGGLEKPFRGESRILLKSEYGKKVPPKMKAAQITKAVIKNIKTNKYDLIVINFPNPDIIGHTANYIDCVKALEHIDICVQNIVREACANNYFTVVTADHGNIEEIVDEKGEMQPAHTTNKVMFTIIDEERPDLIMKNDCALCDVAPTVIYLMGLKPNKAFKGESICTLPK